MSVCGNNGHSEDKNATDDVIPSVHDNHKEKPASKVVRVLTVLAYLLSVSMAAILLSVYYVCVWKSPELPPLNDTGKLNARRAPPPHHSIIMERLQSSGGGDTPVNEHTPLTSNSFTIPANESVSTTPANQTNQTLNDIEDLTESVYPINGTTNDTGSFNYTESIT
uniref:InaF motif containing 2 n=1 Tax=Bombyx mori TaxID=7091 RepID=A0A8R1WFR5_BOMMO|nr:uncharacterized protein LOC101738037 isoform X2 [Bombyx mori]